MTEKHQAIALIVALDGQNGIGRKGDLLCHLPDDLKHFKQITTGHVVIMGRKTYASLPKGALPNRTNIVITSQAREDFPGCKVARSVEEALSLCSGQEKVFIIGGGQLYRTSLHLVSRLYITRIHHIFDDADTFFPEINETEWELTGEKHHLPDERHPYGFTFQTYSRKNR